MQLLEHESPSLVSKASALPLGPQFYYNSRLLDYATADLTKRFLDVDSQNSWIDEPYVV